MTSAKDQKLSRSASPSEKEHPKPQNAAQHIPTPAPDASPEQIRAYIFHLLTTKRKLPEDYVRPVVARWQLGSGQELRSYSPAMYLRIFGHEDGWIIYREVMLAKLREEHDAKSTVRKNLHYIVPISALSFTLLTILLMIKGVLREGAAVLTLSLGIGACVIGFFIALIQFLEGKTPAEVVDGALYECTNNIVTQRRDDSASASSKG